MKGFATVLQWGDRKYRRGELSATVKRHIKDHEKELDKVCRIVWSFTNPKGEQYLFGSFCSIFEDCRFTDSDKTIITLGYFSPLIHRFIPEF